MDRARVKLAIACRDVRGVTGTTTTILEHSRRLAALGWEVHVFGERLDSARIRDAGAHPRRVPAWPFGSAFKRRLFSWLFERRLKRERFDLVWGHGDTLTQDVLSLHNCVHAAHQCAHDGPLPASSGVGRMHARMLSEKRFRLLIANSELMKREVAARFRVDEASMAVIHPGHDPKRFHPAGRRPAGELSVGLITSGDFAKRGVSVFIEAVSRLRTRVRCLIMGQERRLAPYLRQAAQAGVADRIRFLPPDPAVEGYYRSLDLYVHPALYEEFGQSVQEAAACGIPVLTNRRVGAAELLRGAALEGVIPGTGAAELAAAMERILSTPDLRERMAEDAAASVRHNTWDENFRKTYPLLKGLK
ncbi:MAG: glycosyltransferase family 4 protein [Elusimicrobiota bacterium]